MDAGVIKVQWLSRWRPAFVAPCLLALVASSAAEVADRGAALEIRFAEESGTSAAPNATANPGSSRRPDGNFTPPPVEQAAYTLPAAGSPTPLRMGPTGPSITGTYGNPMAPAIHDSPNHHAAAAGWPDPPIAGPSSPFIAGGSAPSVWTIDGPIVRGAGGAEPVPSAETLPTPDPVGNPAATGGRFPHGVVPEQAGDSAHRPWGDLEAGPMPSHQVLAAIGEQRPEEVEQAYERVLDLFPDGNSRQLIERVREATIATEIGEDTTAEEWVTVQDNTSITWGGRIHGDYVNWINDDQFGGQPDHVEFRRLRLFAAGEGYGVYDFQLDIGLAPEFDLGGGVQEELALMAGSGIEIKDAFVGLHDIPLLGYVRIGHMRTPFSLEQLTSSNFLTFLERALPHRLYPGRELGIAAFHHTPSERMSWGYGVFFDELPEMEPNIEDDNQGVRAIGRVTWTPWYDVPSDGRYVLHAGLSYAYTRPRLRENPDVPGTFLRAIRFNARPETHRGDHLIDTDDIDADRYHVLNPELALVRGPLSLQSELTWARIDEVDGDVTDLYGAYAYLSWFLTGEHRTYDPRQGRFERITPFENFWIVRTPRGVRRGWGAWELGVRWSYLEFPDYGQQQLQDLTVGLNWYWNPHTRVMFNWIHPWARSSPASLLPHAEGDVLSMRVQVDF